MVTALALFRRFSLRVTRRAIWPTWISGMVIDSGRRFHDANGRDRGRRIQVLLSFSSVILLQPVPKEERNFGILSPCASLWDTERRLNLRLRSEERRVGKECRTRSSMCNLKIK